MKKYNFNSYLETNEFKLKSDNTKFIKYGDINYINVEKMNETKIKNGIITSPEKLDEWHLYKRIVWKLTNRNRKELFNTWDGKDYYDNELIKENLILNRYHNNYPTIDHKTSVFYGFHNKIPIDIISGMDNLCITKRIINIKKRINNSL